MNARNFFLLVCGCSGLLLDVVGGHRGSLRAAPAEAAPVAVSQPVAREVTDYVDFTGRTQAVKSVNVVARSAATWSSAVPRGIGRQGRGPALRGRSQALPGPVRSGCGPREPG